MNPNQEGACYPLSHVLRQELEALRPGCFARENSWGSQDEPQKRQTAYRIAGGLDLAALSLSGGGIRSACVALGVIQALAEAGLLRRFHFLSTVSGGGYIGSWLSAWLYWNRRSRNSVDTVLEELTTRRKHPDEEPPPIRQLRAYSSYLTPKLGLTSADTWAAVTLVVRNLVLNWLILVPAICLLVLSVKIIAALLHTAALASQSGIAKIIATILFAFVLLAGAGWSLRYKLRQLYPSITAQALRTGTGTTATAPAAPKAKHEQRQFLLQSVLPAIAAGMCFAWLVECWLGPGTEPSWLAAWQSALVMIAVAVGVVCAAVVSLPAKSVRLTFLSADFVGWIFAAISAGGAIWLGVHFYPVVGRAQAAHLESLLVVFGMPWFMLSMLIGQLGYVLARSYSPNGDFEREWLARAGGWFIIAALAWIVVSGLVLLGSVLLDALIAGLPRAWRALAAIGGVGTLSAVLTALFGKSSTTPARGQDAGPRGKIANVALAVSGPLLAASLLILLSVLLDEMVLGQPLTVATILGRSKTDGSYAEEWVHLVVAAALLAGVMFAADFLVNVNRFSLHAVYRNRLIRAFLGGQHTGRLADGFTDFDPDDNLRMCKLWDGDPLEKGDWRPFHVLNLTLNLAATKNLAWQQRKAESFTVTPLFCGCANLGYRHTEEYGDPGGDGISLGTAMAISGAAVSPNMGYHSSPSITFLLTLLNVRLGWWLGNPGPAGGEDGRIGRIVKPKIKAVSFNRQPHTPYRQDAPWLSLRPLLVELFGLTGDDSRYVYLSDGGHFEDLGLYEMVRRRCRWIMVSDADADPKRGFEDLGNAVRKIWIDLGVRITFEKSDLLMATDTAPAGMPYCALGTIEYRDGTARAPGKILYIKPVVRGDEPAADIIAYLRAHTDFPHQSTAEQWFDEPQLESYRMLGYWMTKRIVDAATNGEGVDTLDAFFEALERVDFTKLELRKKPPLRYRRWSELAL